MGIPYIQTLSCCVFLYSVLYLVYKDGYLHVSFLKHQSMSFNRNSSCVDLLSVVTIDDIARVEFSNWSKRIRINTQSKKYIGIFTKLGTLITRRKQRNTLGIKSFFPPQVYEVAYTPLIINWISLKPGITTSPPSVQVLDKANLHVHVFT